MVDGIKSTEIAGFDAGKCHPRRLSKKYLGVKERAVALYNNLIDHPVVLLHFVQHLAGLFTFSMRMLQIIQQFQPKIAH
ncbi:hypothetical protein [Paenibacillus sp. Soil787]|uniref:hypothetical protein n=1 Tax=Paenibacillus sp. Soil787 TaxID=1736411 RepID=UPI000703B21E|nr:hypothetical protein [Paenibacillus sp. Soil787]KRF09776.1 hypothetical protein ASG93_18200 [Paenibacillus sp. Soil787]